jgi:hypothetical protein
MKPEHPKAEGSQVGWLSQKDASQVFGSLHDERLRIDRIASRLGRHRLRSAAEVTYLTFSSSSTTITLAGGMGAMVPGEPGNSLRIRCLRAVGGSQIPRGERGADLMDLVPVIRHEPTSRNCNRT